MLKELFEHGVAVYDKRFRCRVLNFPGDAQAGGAAVQAFVGEQREESRGDRLAGDELDFILCVAIDQQLRRLRFAGAVCGPDPLYRPLIVEIH